MENEQHPQGAYPYSAPPTSPGALLPAQPVTKWPVILGVIAIVFGVLGVLGAVWGLLSPAVMSSFMPDMPPEVVEQMERTQGWTMISSAISLPVALLLLIAGVGLARRRPWSVTAARIWAGLKMLLVVVGLGMMWQIEAAALESSFQGNPAMPQAGSAIVTVIQGFSVVFGLAWGWALPVFMLIWLSRAKIKAEVATWN